VALESAIGGMVLSVVGMAFRRRRAAAPVAGAVAQELIACALVGAVSERFDGESAPPRSAVLIRSRVAGSATEGHHARH
jgi:hypothetical protein